MPDLDLEPLFNKLFSAANASGHKDIIMDYLTARKTQLESAAAARGAHRKPARSITLEDAVQYFSITYRSKDPDSFYWKIETLPEVQKIQPEASLSEFLGNYMQNFDRSSEAACKVPTNIIMLYCVAELKGRTPKPTGYEVFPTTQKPWTNIKICCDVSFTHLINDTPDSQRVVVSGRVDQCVGFVFRTVSKPNRRIHSLLLSVGAKNLESAYGQLVVYLASVHESRIIRGKTYSSVYGVATDGLKYVFVTITNEGFLLFSKQFDVINGDLPVVLGCLRYILERAISLSPNSSPMSDMLVGVDDDADEELDLDDNPYIKGDRDDDDDDDDDEYDE